MRLGSRQLHAQKSGSLILGEGIPDKEMGADGDLRLHLTSFGLKLYAKYKSQWFAFTPDGGAATQELITTTGTGEAAESGYVNWPGGFLLQWGHAGTTVPAALGTTTAVTFPTQFPNKVVAIVANYVAYPNDTGGAADSVSINGNTISVTGFTASTATDKEGFYWIAIGN